MKNLSLLSRSYDLRWIFEQDIDAEFFEYLWYGFTIATGARRIALWYDARLSSPVLKDAFISGARKAGAHIIEFGLCSSDMLSYGTCSSPDIEAGVMITASHNPAEYNGMKSISHDAEPYNLKTWWPRIIEAISPLEDISSLPIGWSLESRDIREAWVRQILSFSLVDTPLSHPVRVVADAGNGVAGVFLEQLAPALGIELVPLFLEPDGNFPHHHPNPMIAGNREDARIALHDTGAAMAWIFDGDADRVVILDEKGELIPSGILAAIIAHAFLEQWERGFVGNTPISHAYRDIVDSYGWEYIMGKVGNVYIRELMMRDPKYVFGAEHSAHYFLRDNYYTDSGIVAAVLFLSIMLRSGRSASALVEKYRTYTGMEEENYIVDAPHELLAFLRTLSHDGTVSEEDGYLVTYDDGSWWNIRASSNEPLVRLNLESPSPERYHELRALVLRTLAQFGAREMLH